MSIATPPSGAHIVELQTPGIEIERPDQDLLLLMKKNREGLERYLQATAAANTEQTLTIQGVNESVNDVERRLARLQSGEFDS